LFEDGGGFAGVVGLPAGILVVAVEEPGVGGLEEEGRHGAIKGLGGGTPELTGEGPAFAVAAEPAEDVGCGDGGVGRGDEGAARGLRRAVVGGGFDAGGEGEGEGEGVDAFPEAAVRDAGGDASGEERGVDGDGFGHGQLSVDAAPSVGGKFEEGEELAVARGEGEGGGPGGVVNGGGDEAGGNPVELGVELDDGVGLALAFGARFGGPGAGEGSAEDRLALGTGFGPRGGVGGLPADDAGRGEGADEAGGVFAGIPGAVVDEDGEALAWAPLGDGGKEGSGIGDDHDGGRDLGLLADGFGAEAEADDGREVLELEGRGLGGWGSGLGFGVAAGGLEAEGQSEAEGGRDVEHTG